MSTGEHRAAALHWIVTRSRQRGIYTQLISTLNNLSLGHVDQRGVNGQVLSLGANTGSLLKTCDEFRAAVRIAAVIECVHTDENIAAFNHLGPCQRVTQEDKISRRNVGDWWRGLFALK